LTTAWQQLNMFVALHAIIKKLKNLEQ